MLAQVILMNKSINIIAPIIKLNNLNKDIRSKLPHL